MTTQTIRKILNRDFIITFFALFALTFVFYILIPTLPIYLLRLGSTEIEIGVLIGIFSLSSVAVRPFVGRALLKIPEKTFMIAGAFLLALTSVAYLFAPPFLALFDSEGLSRNWVRILPYCLIYIHRQYQLRGPSGRKLRLLLFVLQPLQCLSSSPWNVSYQSL
jgi:MFS family permease